MTEYMLQAISMIKDPVDTCERTQCHDCIVHVLSNNTYPSFRQGAFSCASLPYRVQSARDYIQKYAEEHECATIMSKLL